jgi:L-threonylcarbamoyladenylate synthase
MATNSSISVREIRDAALALKLGHLVAFPTETVYGLGADACNKKAVSRIYEVKGRPANHPVIVHISSINILHRWAKNIPDYATKLAKNFWPGPMTLILQRTALAQDFITGGQSNVGIRVPSHNTAISLLKEFEGLGGLGIAAPSANRFGKISPTNIFDVKSELGEYLVGKDQIIDGGFCEIGIESTIIDCTQPKPIILRPGYISIEMIESVLSTNLQISNAIQNSVKAPGLLKSHYSPNGQVVPNADAKPGDGFVALAHIPTPAGAIRLASPKDYDEYAYLLYRSLRLADSKKLTKIHVVPVDDTGLGKAINNRIIKASGEPTL